MCAMITLHGRWIKGGCIFHIIHKLSFGACMVYSVVGMCKVYSTFSVV